MNDKQLAVLAAWIDNRSNLTRELIAYARSIGIDIEAQDCVTLFHYVNDKRSNRYERNARTL